MYDPSGQVVADCAWDRMCWTPDHTVLPKLRHHCESSADCDSRICMTCFVSGMGIRKGATRVVSQHAQHTRIQQAVNWVRLKF